MIFGSLDLESSFNHEQTLPYDRTYGHVNIEAVLAICINENTFLYVDEINKAKHKSIQVLGLYGFCKICNYARK